MFCDSWVDLGEHDPVRGLAQIAPGLWEARSRRGWSEVCQWASRTEGGQWWPKEHGLTWCCGSRYQWIVEPEQVEPILKAREITLGFADKVGYSVGSCARKLLLYAGPPQYAYRSNHAFLSDITWGFQSCSPSMVADATMLDVKSYYYSLLTRLPTWRLTLRAGGRIAWHGDFPGESDRRAAILGAVADHKLLRNALVGCMTGRTTGSVYYHAGDRCLHRGGPGPFQGAGWLLVRSAYELTRSAAIETGSILSNVDCVTTTGGRWPSIWDRCGLVVETRASGEAEICAPTIYKIGTRATKFYLEGSRFRDHIPIAADPHPQYHRAWLLSAS